jgi:molecular chaperone GrpE
MAKQEETLENETVVDEEVSEGAPESGEVIEGEVIDAEVVETEVVEPEVADDEGEAPEIEAEVVEEAEGEVVDPEAQLQEKLEEAEAMAQEYLGGWQRAQATFENYRKRMQKEREEWRTTSNARLLGKLLPILDDFDRAFSMMPESLKDDAWFSGIKLIQRKIQSILETENVKPMEAEPGDTFDPKFHQAVLHQETEDFEDGQIMTVVEKGYVLGKRVLRPAMVVVAKAPPEPVPEEDAEEAQEPASKPEAEAESEAEASTAGGPESNDEQETEAETEA